MNINCCNCGAPRNPNQTACAYCNTPYGPRWPEVNEDGLRYQDAWVTENRLGIDRAAPGERERFLANIILTPKECILYADDKPIVVIKEAYNGS